MTFDQLVEAYSDQVHGLVAGGVDLLLVETVFDPLNAKAALFAIDRYFQKHGIDLPVMVSVTIFEGGVTMTAQTIAAFWASIAPFDILSVGINCAVGVEKMRAWVEELAGIAPRYLSCYPPGMRVERIRAGYRR